MASLSGTEVAPGQILAGKFRIDRILGRGGMGVVVQATHLALEERVAIKFLLPEALENSEAVRRFEREARAAVKIKSEHVARVIDVGTLETGSPYMVMEYLSGVDLAQYLERQGTLSISEAVDYVVQAMEAIAEAHSLGIVHRDLKPANLFRIVRSDGTPSIKVLDFGISKVGTDHSITQTSSMMGSPYYMSPEQMVSSKSVDARTDIWSLAIILYELVAGRVPFDGEVIPEIVAKVLQSPVPPVTSRVDLPPGLERVIEKALAKERTDRYPDVAAFALALAPFVSADARASVQRVSRVLGVVAETTLPDGAAQHDEPERPAPASVTTFGGSAATQLDLPAGVPAKARGSLYVGLAAALVALAGAGMFALSARPKGPVEDGLVSSPATPGPAPTAMNPAPSDPGSAAPDASSPASVEPQKPEKAPEDPETQARAPEPASEEPEKPAPSSTPSASSPAANVPPKASRPAASSHPRPTSPAPTTPAAAPTNTPASSKPPTDLFSDRK